MTNTSETLSPPLPDEEGPRYAERALAALRMAGLRITRPRRSIVELLERTRTPLTAGAIHEALRKRRIAIDLASVYRTLAVLETQSLIHRLSVVEGVIRCEPGFAGAQCHHHIVCRRCGEAKEFRCDGLGALRGELMRTTHWRGEEHRIELLGLCPACARVPADA